MVAGFTAYAPIGNMKYNSDDIVIFNSTVSNIGGYYQTNSSQFICPVDGMYAFTLNAMTGYSDEFYGAIMKESDRFVSILGLNPTGSHDGVSNSVIIACSKGERVWIRCLTDGDAVYNDSRRFTTFSGVLRQQF